MEATDALKRVVQQRAGQLRGEGKGYLQAVRVVVDELQGTEQGKDTPIGRMGAAAAIPWVPIFALVFEVTKWAVAKVAGSLDAKNAQRKQLEQQVSPWISEVYQGAVGPHRGGP